MKQKNDENIEFPSDPLGDPCRDHTVQSRSHSYRLLALKVDVNTWKILTWESALNEIDRFTLPKAMDPFLSLDSLVNMRQNKLDSSFHQRLGRGAGRECSCVTNIAQLMLCAAFPDLSG